MDLIVPAAFFLSAAIVVLVLTGGVLSYLRRRAILDIPTERSSHAAPTPRGGGLAVIPVVVVAWLAADYAFTIPFVSWLVPAALVLAGVSWIDDRRGLSQIIRLLAQVAMVAALLWVWPDDRLVLQGLAPIWLDRLVAGLAWIWFINLFNFMDGIDGISGVEVMSLGIGAGLVASLAGAAPSFGILGAAIAGAGLGFLWWNWQPAKIFLGDVGSVPLGLMLGWLLLELAAAGLWPAAVILPLYYLADSGFTLIRRILRGEKFWQAHREHFYQKAVIMGRSHKHVSIVITLCNIGLILMALMSYKNPGGGIAAAAVITFVAFLALKRVPAKL